MLARTTIEVDSLETDISEDDAIDLQAEIDQIIEAAVLNGPRGRAIRAACTRYGIVPRIETV